MNRIVIVGSPGSGKSTLARQMGERLGLPVHHLDLLYWRPGWIESDRDEFAARQRELVRQNRWIIDGNYGRTLEIRVKAADTVVFLDLPKAVCCWRVIKRRFQRDRPDMPEGCVERFDREFFEFLGYIWDFPRTRRPRILELMSRLKDEKTYIHLRSGRDVRRFLVSLEDAEREVRVHRENHSR